MIKEIFPIHYWHAPVKNFEAVQEEISRAVADANWDYYQESQGWGKTHKFAKRDPFYGNIIGEYAMSSFTEQIISAVKQYNPTYTFSKHTRPTSWLVKYDEGDYAHIHNHPPAVISGAYYYDVQDNDDSFFFHDGGSSINSPRVSVGSLLLFPSELLHGVRKLETGTRTVLSFNLHY